MEPAPYNHEKEAARARERRADDWGGDDVFATHPRRRIGTRVATGELTLPPRRSGYTVHRAEPLVAEHSIDDDPALELSEVEDLVAEPAPRASEEDAPRGPEAAVASEDLTDGIKWAPTAGRRTVQITGRPDAEVISRSPERRRPPRTAGERLGARPDRVAGWAFGLGMLLITVAVGTAQL